MKTIATSLLALALSACGVDTSKLNEQAQPSPSPSASAEPAQDNNSQQASGQTVVQVQNETNVTVTVGSTTAVQAGQAAPAGELLRFADGAFGWFFADGSFDRGALYVHGQQAAGYCRFEAPGCDGRCVLDSLPVKDSLFTNGASFFRAIETETDLGRTVVSSIWRSGHCEADVKTLQHAYTPAHAWVLDAGDSTVPSEHQ